MSHTKEPLTYMELPTVDGEFLVLGGDDLGDFGLVASCVKIDDARRIVAAVNACAGVDNAWLESMAKAGGLAAVNHYIAACNQAVSAMTADQERVVLQAEVERVTACAERSQALYERERDLYDELAAELSATQHNAQVMNEAFASVVNHRDELLAELLRVKAICLREFGNGVVNEVVIASVGGHCMCDACKDGNLHLSDCAVHNEPAMPKGPCDCGAIANFGQRQNPSNGRHSEQIDAGLVNGQKGGAA